VLSRTKKSRSGTPEVTQREPARARVPAGGQREPARARVPASGQQAPVGPPAEHFGPSDNGHHRAGTARLPRRMSFRPLKNWRVRSRLLLLVLIPTIAALLLGGLRIASSVQSALAYQRVVRLADLSGSVTGLAQALQNERDDTVEFIVLGTNGGRAAELIPHSAITAPVYQLQVLRQDYTATSRLASQVKSQIGAINSSYSALVQQEAQATVTAIDGLQDLRAEATGTDLPTLVVIQEYSNAINTLLAVDDQLATGSNDSTLADTASVVSLVSSIKEEASEQQAILTSALNSDLVGLGQFGPSQQAAITGAEAEEQGNEAEFASVATSSQRQLFNNALSGPNVAQAQAEEEEAISLASSNSAIATDPTIVDSSTAMSYVVSSMHSVEQQLVASVISRSTSLRNSAIIAVIIDVVGVVLLIGLALISTTVVGRSMVGPLRRLRTGALQVAGVRLPETVQRMSETDGEGVSLEVEPIDVDSTDEIGEVARAFDQVHREAIRLAANEAALRGNVNAMFVNLSRRSQSLVERQLRLIDDLEQGEQDAERLSSLFQMDHLATRMRRNSENLLVLAGHDEARRWNQPVALVDVLRAALSEIEHYERVTLNVQPGIAVRGQAVSDVVHLTAELVENATSFSAAEMPVTIAGHLLSSGGVLLEITDQGVGMGSEEMAHANWRLDNPPVVDVAVSRRMGLFVVARLAAKHGIRVRLRPAASGGLTALVWLPDEAIMHETPDSTPGVRRSDSVAEPAIGRRVDGAFTAADEAATSGWGNVDRTTTEQEINASRMPRFASLRADAEETVLGPKRIPGAGPRPGPGWATTGPLAAFRTVPRPAFDSGSEVAATGPQPVVGAGGEPVADFKAETAGVDSPAAAFDSPAAAFDSPATGPQPLATGPQPLATGPQPLATGPQPLATGPQPLDASAAESSRTSPHPVLGAPATGWEAGSSRGEVIVPPAEGLGEEHRLPIFEAVESDWFRRGRQAVGRPSRVTEPSNGWDSPADEGWRAAEVVHTPSSGGVTSAGLPKRVPAANLVPGAVSAAAGSSSASAPARSAAATRERFASFQRGVRQGRAAANQGESDDEEDKGSE
jgi:signal transduction histidine kinase